MIVQLLTWRPMKALCLSDWWMYRHGSASLGAMGEYGLSADEAMRWINSITFYNERVHNILDQSNGDLASVPMREVKPEDYCVVKIDIENAEWDVVPHLEATGAINRIDELFIEVHFHHKMLESHNWTPYSITLIASRKRGR
jgi:hypothetical protein